MTIQNSFWKIIKTFILASVVLYILFTLPA
jgi:hypothetical protein